MLTNSSGNGGINEIVRIEFAMTWVSAEHALPMHARCVCGCSEQERADVLTNDSTVIQDASYKFSYIVKMTILLYFCRSFVFFFLFSSSVWLLNEWQSFLLPCQAI